MKISGTATLNAPVDELWAAFTDPAVLARTIPGCHGLREVGPDAYRITITAGVASIHGTYEGEVALTDKDPPGKFVLKASGSGAPGTVSASVNVSLEKCPVGGTTLTYDADAVVGGAIGGVGQRMLAGVAKKMAGQFFKAVDDDIAGVRAVEALAAAALPAGAVDAPVALTPAAADRQPGKDFVRGALVGAGIALASVVVGIVVGRR